MKGEGRGRRRTTDLPAGPGATIVWFRQDLRLTDNPALLAAVDRGGAVIPVYIWAPEEEGDWPPGAASRFWLHHSLIALQADLASRGSRLVLRRGLSLEALRDLAAATGAGAVVWNRRYEPAAARRDDAVAAALARDGISARAYNGSLLFDPHLVRTRAGGPFQVFTPFWKACLSAPDPGAPSGPPARLNSPARWPNAIGIADLDLDPLAGWTAGIRDAWRAGEAGAAAALDRLVREALGDYRDLRDRPDVPGTSRLSPYLHHGEIGPRQVWHAVREAEDALRTRGTRRHHPSAAGPFLRQIAWREFAYHLLHHFPHTEARPLRPTFDRFPWRRDPAALRSWERGRTGVPIVDAGLRELWATGWMHNRVRMIAASFLVKDLLLSFREGARWFWDTLVDADLANNTLGWQWVAGCGADAAPFFRIFNPVIQGMRFDPGGVYVRRWVPELAGLPNAWIHRPSQAPEDVHRRAGVVIGRDYPEPIVDHAGARLRALAALSRAAGREPRKAIHGL